MRRPTRGITGAAYRLGFRPGAHARRAGRHLARCMSLCRRQEQPHRSRAAVAPFAARLQPRLAGITLAHALARLRGVGPRPRIDGAVRDRGEHITLHHLHPGRHVDHGFLHVGTETNRLQAVHERTPLHGDLTPHRNRGSGQVNRAGIGSDRVTTCPSA